MEKQVPISRRAQVRDLLSAAGCVAADAEADALIAASVGGAGPLDELVDRRVAGQPLAWVTGWVDFCGIRVRVDPGVFVPRPHTELLARRAATLLPDDGVAVDLCAGSGAVAAVMAAARPRATVIAVDVDLTAVACARRNGVRALLGDLDAPLPEPLLERVDVLTAVVPYVPSDELHLLPRDARENEPRLALDGGERGTSVLIRAARAAGRWLAPGGTALLELGGDQADEVADALRDVRLREVRLLRDADGRDRAIEARRGA